MWPAKTWNKLNFLRCIFGFDLVLKYCLNINETNWLQILFDFFVLTVIVGSIIKMSFLSVFKVLDWISLLLHFCGKVCNWNLNLIWQLMDWIFEFFDGLWLFLLPWYLHRLKFAWVAQRRSSFDDVEFFCWLVWESSNVFVLFSHKFLWYRLMRPIKAIQLFFCDICVFQPSFLARNNNWLWILLQTNLCVFQFFLMIIVFRCSTPFTAIVVFRILKMESLNAPAYAVNLFLAGED